MRQIPSILFRPMMFLMIMVVEFAEGLWVLGYSGLGEIGKAVVKSQVGTREAAKDIT